MSKEKIEQLIVSKLEEQRDDLVHQWNNPIQTETRHCQVDNLLPSDVCDEISRAFPDITKNFLLLDSFREKKKTAANVNDFDPILEAATLAIQSPKVVKFFSEITGIAGLEPDPLLYAGGISMMSKGDFLNPHIDNSHDASRDRFRRLNLLYYISPDWKLENGGNFELWNNDRTEPKTFISGSNKLVVMETTKSSWHSVSKVTVDKTRKCVSNYYFSKSSPDASDYYHVTSFTGRPDEKWKVFLGIIDNGLRNFVALKLKISRNTSRVNKKNGKK
jgi:Rps23 Pro-64 3,4-dihydroxylase Tpa1-like proline 4-hydroxylase